MVNKHSDRLCLFNCECFAFLFHKRRPSGGTAQSRSKAKDVASLLVLAPPALRAHRYAATGPPGPGPMTFARLRLAGFAG